MLNQYQTYRKEHPRLTNNIIFSVVTLVGCLVALLLASPTMAPLEALAVGTGYVGLGLLALTLLIGPLNMLKVRKNPVNLNFRRDAGIWAGIASLAHVVLAFALEINWGGTLLGYFLYKDGSLKLNLFGVSNYVGLAATIVLIFLLVISNNRFLKSLKGKKWKNLQRFNYLLFALVLGHTFTQQINNVRGLWMIAGALLVTAGVMVGQAVGFKIYRKREAERSKVAPGVKGVLTRAAAVKTAPVPATGFSKLKIASAVGIVAMLGIGAGLEGLSLLNQPVTAQSGSVASDETTASETSSAATTPAVSESTSASTATTAAATTAATATATTAATTAATTSAATTAVTTTAAATTTAATTTAATTAATTTVAATTTAATTTAVATTAATTTKAATTTVSSSSKSSGSTHTGSS